MTVGGSGDWRLAGGELKVAVVAQSETDQSQQSPVGRLAILPPSSILRPMATTYRQLLHVESDRVLLPAVRWCDSFTSKLFGFSFHRHLPESSALVLVEKSDNRVNTAVHMMFVFIELGVIWVNSAGEVVDKVLARPWRLSYVPKAPARYVIELHPSFLPLFSIGDHVKFLESKQ